MKNGRITPPDVKFGLHAYGKVYDFSNCIANWKQIELTLRRDATSGIYHMVTFPFEFVLDAYDTVKEIFDTYGYRAKADVYIYLLKHRWPYEAERYHEPKIFNLDWVSYSKSDSKIEIDTDRDSLYDFIKAKNRLVYDIPVSELKQEKQWNFERIELENILTELATSDRERWEVRPQGHNFRHLAMSYVNSEIAIRDVIEEQTVVENLGFDQNRWFLQLNESYTEPVTLRVTGSLDIPYLKMFSDVSPAETRNLKIGFWKKTPDGTVDDDSFLDGVVIDQFFFEGAVSHDFDFEVQLNPKDMDLGVGDRLYFMMDLNRSGDSLNTIYVDTPDGFDFTFKVSYTARESAELIDMIDPKVLLQSLVDKMTDTQGVYQSDIVDFNTDKNNLIYLTAAESIRGIEKTDTNEAKVHTSYRDFIEWMNTLGYEQSFEGNVLTIRKREFGFRKDLTAIELGMKECADLREYVNADYLYSGLKIGYKRKDIENINVRFEFNGIHDYSTDLNLSENIRQLISAYRADCYGIEFLTQERGKDSTDDKSDKDMFIVNISEGDDYYETIPNEFSGNYPNQTLFNGNLNPYNLMLFNQNLLGISAKRLQFTASDANSQILIDGQSINQSHEIADGVGLFDARMYDIASRNIQDLPDGENVNGIVKINYQGNVYEGFIHEIAKSVAWETETTWILFAKKGS